MADKKTALVLASGGVDSTTCLALAVERYGAKQVIALSVAYGQRHEKELQASERVSRHYGVEHLYVDMTKFFQYSDSPLLFHAGGKIPESSYAAQLATKKGPVATYVPFRNGLFLSGAASIALSRGCIVLMYGAHADDAAGSAYPDCSVEFCEAMDLAIRMGTGNAIHLEAPFVRVSKAEVVRQGLALLVPYELTWSCYEGGVEPCGYCATCRDRAAAFAANGVKDPAII